MDRKIQQGEEGPRSGTKKGCSHNRAWSGNRIIAVFFPKEKFWKREANRQRK